MRVTVRWASQLLPDSCVLTPSERQVASLRPVCHAVHHHPFVAQAAPWRPELGFVCRRQRRSGSSMSRRRHSRLPSVHGGVQQPSRRSRHRSSNSQRQQGHSTMPLRRLLRQSLRSWRQTARIDCLMKWLRSCCGARGATLLAVHSACNSDVSAPQHRCQFQHQMVEHRFKEKCINMACAQCDLRCCIAQGLFRCRACRRRASSGRQSAGVTGAAAEAFATKATARAPNWQRDSEGA